MKTIERYVFGSFLSSFVLAFLVLSFVLTIGLLVQIVGYIMDGVPMRLVGEFAMVSLPETLQWSVPLSLLVGAILVFSRLSADGEIAAMRARGVRGPLHPRRLLRQQRGGAARPRGPAHAQDARIRGRRAERARARARHR